MTNTTHSCPKCGDVHTHVHMRVNLPRPDVSAVFPAEESVSITVRQQAVAIVLLAVTAATLLFVAMALTVYVGAALLERNL